MVYGACPLKMKKMIKIENLKVFNLEGALRGMRNPLNSWDKSDSFKADEGMSSRGADYVIGEADMALAKSLTKSGSDHRKFLRQIFVSVDIIAPLYWWKEFDTYKVGTVSNSCSTMHTVHKKEFTLDDFSHEKLFDDTKESLLQTIKMLNRYRVVYLGTLSKEYWWQIIQLLPSSHNQRRTITMTYENAFNMYHARKKHKLDEWRAFCEELKALPYFAEFANLDKVKEK